jgi:hypothetical protein
VNVINPVSIRLILVILLAIVEQLSSPGEICAQPVVQLPPTNSAGVYPGTYSVPPPGSVPGYPTSGTTGYDPYFRQIQPTGAYPQQNNWGFGNLFNWNSSAPVIPMGPANYPTYIPPNTAQPWNPTQGSVYPQGAYPQGSYPPGVYPGQPNVLFPGTGSQPNPTSGGYPYPYGWPGATNGTGYNNMWNTTSSSITYGTSQVMRVFQGVRLRHTWLSGTSGFNDKSPTSLEINDTDVSLVFGIPNFLNSTRSFFIIPSYSQHLWDGPKNGTSDLPGNAFSGFIDTGWDTNPTQTLGVELSMRVGVFSAFDAINSDSLYIQGKAVGRLRLTPTSTAKLGVMYLDRNKIKLLPVAGILWSPNPDSRFDLVFPEPKVSHYVTALGNTDMWWYTTAYYGGGAWTIKQTDDSNDEIDINDIRVMLGLEFGKSEQMRSGFRLGFVEVGYAFNRELIYRIRTSSNLDLPDSIIVRGGFSY